VRVDADALKIFHSEHEESIASICTMWSDCHANVDEIGGRKCTRSAKLLAECFCLHSDVHPRPRVAAPVGSRARFHLNRDNSAVLINCQHIESWDVSGKAGCRESPSTQLGHDEMFSDLSGKLIGSPATHDPHLPL